MPADVNAPLSAELEAALLRELGRTWDEINQNHFRRQLRRPTFALLDGTSRLGWWDGQRRVLALSRTLVLQHPWGAVREVVKHETAHQFVQEILGAHDETAHGPAFERLCRQHGFDGAAAGLPTTGSLQAEDGGRPPILRRIGRLLALAGSANVFEAETAMKTAQRLMLKHNIDAAAASAREGHAVRHLGEARGRVPAHEHVVAGLLARHFFVEAIWIPAYRPLEGRAGRVLEICGTPSNLDVAAYVHGFLLETGERLWRAHREREGLSGDAQRRRYLLGVITGFEEKLEEGEAEAREEGLVWVGDPELKAFLHRRYPRRTSGAGISFEKTEAYEEGRAAGRTIVLRKPVGQGEAPSRGRLLGPSR